MLSAEKKTSAAEHVFLANCITISDMTHPQTHSILIVSGCARV